MVLWSVFYISWSFFIDIYLIKNICIILIYRLAKHINYITYFYTGLYPTRYQYNDINIILII